jgi:hypothetical protein
VADEIGLKQVQRVNYSYTNRQVQKKQDFLLQLKFVSVKGREGKVVTGLEERDLKARKKNSSTMKS